MMVSEFSAKAHKQLFLLMLHSNRWPRVVNHILWLRLCPGWPKSNNNGLWFHIPSAVFFVNAAVHHMSLMGVPSTLPTSSELSVHARIRRW